MLKITASLADGIPLTSGTPSQAWTGAACGW